MSRALRIVTAFDQPHHAYWEDNVAVATIAAATIIDGLCIVATGPSAQRVGLDVMPADAAFE
jgi:hypothetical protein